ncbi:MAG: mycofactocin-associated electron transfer flavoprotein beta subunit [Acidimicrobiales bacterium]
MAAIAACVKWTDLERGAGFSLADEAAVETALTLATAWGTDDVTVVCVGPVEADAPLRGLLACGASRAVRIDSGPLTRSHDVGAALGSVLMDLDADFVICGDASPDRGSGTVPAYVAHHLGAAQALGLVDVKPASMYGAVEAVRRLDGGRREVLTISAPAVLSVEGAVSELRRAPLSASLAAREERIEVRSDPRVRGDVPAEQLEPWRPRARVLPAPVGGHALERVGALTGALVDRTPPRTVVLDPADAADTIFDQLRSWGYVE